VRGSGPRPHTDYGNAERLAARHGHDLRYCHPWGQWLVWDGRRWCPDDTGEIVRRAKDTVRALYAEAAAIVNEELRKAVAAWARSSESWFRLKTMVHLAQSEPGLFVRPEQLDADPWLLNVANGTLDLRTGALRPHDPADLLTRLAPVAYDPQAAAPTWEAFLERILAGSRELIEFLQRAVGYALTGDTREQVLFILYGTGANGKSTLLAALAGMLGDYAQHTPGETLLSRRPGCVPNDVARLRGARLVMAVEAEENERLAESLVKQMTGGDPLTARFLHHEWFEFTPDFKLFLATNHNPLIRGTDLAIWRRIRRIPFAVTIPEAEQDRTLSDRLRAELPGILAWAVRGCLAWQRDGLGLPPEVQCATADYRLEMDVLANFLEDCCLQKPAAQVAVQALYQAYTGWCQANGEPPLAKRTFGCRLKDRGFQPHRGAAGTRTWLGIGLLHGPQQPDRIDPASEWELLLL
jgi:putative DNA primase/helicase